MTFKSLNRCQQRKIVARIIIRRQILVFLFQLKQRTKAKLYYHRIEREKKREHGMGNENENENQIRKILFCLHYYIEIDRQRENE